jgi:hypothetical protein
VADSTMFKTGACCNFHQQCVEQTFEARNEPHRMTDH